MEAAKKETIFTIEDIFALPDGQRAELIDGQIYMMATPSRIHQKISMELSRSIGNYIHDKKGSCEVYTAPFAVFLNQDNKTYVEPDISVICNKDKLTNEGCNGAPDWIIEIVSPSSRQMDYFKKLFKYRMAAVREYWIVDPKKKNVIVYDFEHESMQDYTFNDIIKVGIYDDLEIDFSDIKLE